MFESTTTVQVRYAETDQMGVVYHANYLVWLEIGRTTLIEDLGFSYAGMEEKGYVSPVTNLSIKYRRPVKYGQKVIVKTWVQTHGKLRTTYGYAVEYEDGTVAATATSEHVVVGREEFKPLAFEKVDPELNAAYVRIARELN